MKIKTTFKNDFLFEKLINPNEFIYKTKGAGLICKAGIS